MSKHDKWSRTLAATGQDQQSARTITPPAPPALQIRIHFQRAVIVRHGATAALAGAQGLGNLTTDTAQILERDAAGILLALEGKCAFIPWANIAWIEQL